MKLDFNHDGHVSTDDLKQGFIELYEFIKTYQYYQTAIEIKSKLYQEAINYI